jgi:hypothetical protein
MFFVNFREELTQCFHVAMTHIRLRTWRSDDGLLVPTRGQRFLKIQGESGSEFRENWNEVSLRSDKPQLHQPLCRIVDESQ